MWDDLELLDPVGESLMIRDGERAVDRVLPPEARPAYLGALSEARDAGGYVILDGDWGGQVYVTAPATAVACDPARLGELLRGIDASAWGDQGDGSRKITYRSGAPGASVAGGMGGGVLLDRPWIHPELVQLGLGDAIGDVLAGRADALPNPRPVLSPRALEALARALDEEDPRLRSYLAPAGHEDSRTGERGIEEIIGPPIAGDLWYHLAVRRALAGVRPDSNAVVRRWHDEGRAGTEQRE
jgi:hypothetical protein